VLFDEKDGILGGAERYGWEVARQGSSVVTRCLDAYRS